MQKIEVRHTDASGQLKRKYCADGLVGRTAGKSTFALDSMPNKAPISMDNPEKGVWMQGKDGTFLCVRVPKRKADELGSVHQKWRDTIKKAFAVKDDIDRGQDCNGSADRYVIFGYRKIPLGRNVGKYAFKSNCTKKDKEEIDHGVKTMVEDIECIARTFIHPDDLEKLGALRRACSLPSMTQENLSTQFSVGRDYWSPIHVNNDYFWTVLSVLDSNYVKEDSRVVHRFVFPEYGAAVPLSPGDILIFNPSVLHGCTNSTIPGSLIFSAYVSSKTVATQAANSLL